MHHQDKRSLLGQLLHENKIAQLLEILAVFGLGMLIIALGVPRVADEPLKIQLVIYILFPDAVLRSSNGVENA